MSNRVLRTLILGISALVLSGAIPANADNCDKRIRDAERNVQKNVQRHGEHSKQAEESRRHLADVRASCHR